MDVLNSSACLRISGSKGDSNDVLQSKNGNFTNDSDSNFSNSISSTPTSLVSTPSPSSTDNSNCGNSQNHLLQTSNVTPDSLSFLLRQYSLLSNNDSNLINNNLPDDNIHFLKPNSSNNILNSYFEELNSTQNKCNISNYNGVIGKSASNQVKVNSKKGENTNHSKVNENTSTIPPGFLSNLNNKNSTMLNGEISKLTTALPNTLEALKEIARMNSGDQMCLVNGGLTSSTGSNVSDIFHPTEDVNLNVDTESQFKVPPQILQQPPFSNFGLPINDAFGPPGFNRSNSFISSSNSHNSWPSKSGQEPASNAFDELSMLGGSTTESPFTNNHVHGSKFGVHTKANRVGDIGFGLAAGSLGSNNVDSLFSELMSKKSSKDIWNESSSFFNSCDPSTSASNNAVSTPSSSASGSLFDPQVWSQNSDRVTPWPEASWQFASFNNATNLQTAHTANASDVESFKKLLASKNGSVKLASLLDSRGAYDFKERVQVNEMMASFKKYVLEATLSQDINLCESNFEIYSSMLKNDLAKFEASTFTMDELRMFQEIYKSFIRNRDSFYEEKSLVEEHFEQFTLLVKKFVLSNDASSLCSLDDNVLRQISDKLANTFSVLYSAKYNNSFLNLVKFYRNMIYSIPSDILNNMPLVIEQSKLMCSNNGNPSDSLFAAYQNFVQQLNKYNEHNRNEFSNNRKEDDSGNNNSIMLNSKSMLTVNKDVNNNKNFDNLKDCPITHGKESDSRDMKKQRLMSNKLPPIFNNVHHIKCDASVYMPFFYPVDHQMLNLHGPIATFCNRIKTKSPFYMSANRQVFEVIAETELAKSMPGPVVLEKSDILIGNKSFNKLLTRLKKHFPNLPIKQLTELALQAKYAIMKKHKIQYGFSGFKIKDLVKYIVEYICDMAVPISNDVTKGTSLAGKGVAWSVVASATSLPTEQQRTSPGSTRPPDSTSSSSPSLCGSQSLPQICALCKTQVSSNATEEKRKGALIACNHLFHKECIDFLTKIKLKPVCPQCDQFILRNDEFPSL